MSETEWKYAYRADEGPIVDSAFGGLVKFDTYDSAQHAGSKWFLDTLEILRRRGDEPWALVRQERGKS